MMKHKENVIIYSPSDLVQFMESPFGSWMSRLHLEKPDAAIPDEPTGEEELIARTGDEHEARFLAHLKEQGRDVCEIDKFSGGFDQTREAIEEGREIIFQGALESGRFAGFTDFLVRGDGGQYEIWDAKLARKSKPYHLVQLCYYAEMLADLTGRRPEIVRVVLGNDEVVPFRTAEFFDYYLQLKDAFLSLMDRFKVDGKPPFPDPRADHRLWSSTAERWLKEKDHLIQVAGITVGQITKLEAAGINTLADLASTSLKFVPKLKNEVFNRLREQARIQEESRRQPEGSAPKYEIITPSADDPHRGLALLPPPSSKDVFFDIEGYPLIGDGLEYLLGATVLRGDGTPDFRDWWAHDEDEEKASFEAFIDWVHRRWRADRSMHIYHYAPYEVTAMRRLMGKYATREDKVDDLFRNDVFIDLYRIVQQAVLLGAESYSLKKVEKIYRPEREGDVQTALGSVVYYGQWLESQQSRDWKKSDILKKIRDYNRDDCESTWELAEWLRGKQAEHRIVFSPPADPGDRTDQPDSTNLPEGVQRRQKLAERLLKNLPPKSGWNGLSADERERLELTELLGHLVEFHRRDSKPVFWAKYDRSEMTEEELYEDINCLAGLERTGDEPQPIKQSVLFRYRFDPDQDTKISVGKKVFLAENITVSVTVEEMDDDGLIALKVSRNQLRSKLDADELPRRLSLIPDEFVSPGAIEDAIERRTEEWADGESMSPLLRRLLTRAKPVISGHSVGALLVREGESSLDAARRVVPLVEDSALIIQGPPGCGKTFTGSHLIRDLLAEGKNVGVVSNSHKAIINLLEATNELMDGGLSGLYKPKQGDKSAFEAIPSLRTAKSGDDYHGGLIAGTAWLFSREDMEGRLDYLFVDEAGQVSLANLVGMSGCTRNVILLGDQMQLAQPVQGSHPGETGSSALEYLLGDHATVPPDRGIFLDVSFRMHPQVCRFISEAVYEGRLQAAEKNERQVLTLPGNASLLTAKAGILFHPVPHTGNTQASEEEAEAIMELTGELLQSRFKDKEGKTRRLAIEDILYVSPYNMQVRLLERRLPEGARVGSVDRFQGQQAPVVVLSLCSSAGDFGSRGLGFILDQNRLNVAISRAQALAVVVADPAIAHTAVNNVGDMRRVSMFCRIEGESTPEESVRVS